MNLQDELKAMNQAEQACFRMMGGLAGVLVSEFGPETAKLCVGVLSRNPQFFDAVVDMGRLRSEDPAIVRKLTHPGPTPVADPPESEGA